MFEQFLSIWTSRRPGKSPAPARRRLSLETLEDRLTPASLNPVAGDDFGYIFLDKPNPAQASGTTTANKKPIYLSIKGAGLLLNDLDPAGPGVAYQLRARQESPATTGELVLDPNGNFEIKNLPMDFEGTISFTYRVAGPSGVSEPATVTRVVTRESRKDHAPVAKDDTVLFGTTAGKAGSLSFDVLSNDMSYLDKPLRTVTFANPAKGRLNFLGEGRFEYRPAPDFNGVDSFTYLYQDGNGVSNEARVRVLVVSPADFIALNVNAADPSNTILRFRVVLDGSTLSQVRFFVNGVQQEVRANVSGEFSFRYDQNVLHPGTNTLGVEATPKSGVRQIYKEFLVTRTHTQAREKSLAVGKIFPLPPVLAQKGVPPIPFVIDAIVNYDRVEYLSIVATPNSKLIWVQQVQAGLFIAKAPELYDGIKLWGPTLTLVDHDGESATSLRDQDILYNSDTGYQRSSVAAPQQWFKANNGLHAHVQTDLLWLDSVFGGGGLIVIPWPPLIGGRLWHFDIDIG